MQSYTTLLPPDYPTKSSPKLYLKQTLSDSYIYHLYFQWTNVLVLTPDCLTPFSKSCCHDDMEFHLSVVLLNNGHEVN